MIRWANAKVIASCRLSGHHIIMLVFFLPSKMKSEALAKRGERVLSKSSVILRKDCCNSVAFIFYFMSLFLGAICSKARVVCPNFQQMYFLRVRELVMKLMRCRWNQLLRNFEKCTQLGSLYLSILIIQ